MARRWLAWLLVSSAAIVLQACASSGAVPRPFPTPSGSPIASAPTPGDLRPDGPAIAGTALALRGAPYRTGGSDPTGFDCSGFVQYVLARHDIGLPREVREQSRLGRRIDQTAIHPGDLLFFGTRGSRASHVGIAIGDGRFVHAPSSRGVVRVERLASTYWTSRYIDARRVN